MPSVPKKWFFVYFRQRLENVKWLSAVQPDHKGSPAASFEPEQNILAGAEIDALARYWSIYENRTFQRAADRMAEFLATHGNARIWNKCSHADLRGRAALLKTDTERQALETVLIRLLPQSAAPIERMLSWRDDPDFVTVKSDAKLQNGGIPNKFLADSRYGAILYRCYRCAWVHELNPDDAIQTEEIIPWGQLARVQGEDSPEPYYMARNHVRRLVIPAPFIIGTFEQVLDSFQRSVPDAASMAL